MPHPMTTMAWLKMYLYPFLTRHLLKRSAQDLNRLIAHTQTPGYISALNASHAAQSATFKSSQRARYNAERAELGLPPRPNTPPETAAAARTGSQLVEVVVRQGFQADWGFLLFRTNYGDNAAWERYEQEFKRLVDKSVIDDGAESIHDGCMVKMVDDPELEGASVEDVRQCVAFPFPKVWWYGAKQC